MQYEKRPVPLACPVCHGSLEEQNARLACVRCRATFGYRGAFPDLVVGERFEDLTEEAQMLYEEQSNEALTRDYILPLFRTLWPRRPPAPRILSLGCGTGMDVDLLCDEGFECVGIDCGNRTAIWHRRRHQENLLLANGKHMPFEDGEFDAVFCGCVFPHVGVVGDTFQVTPDYFEQRRALAMEMTRVLKPDGKILVSSPNRWFPCDIFHGRPHGGFKPRLNWPGDPFLLSLADYRRLFAPAGWSRATPQPVEGYWGFVRSRNSLLGRVMALPVRFVFWMVSRPGLRGLRSSFLNPWIVVLVEKERAS
jgi:SAM-dependent methyltransferase